MKAWVDYIRRHDAKTGDSRLWKGDFHFCDWLALDGEDSLGNRFGGTERTYLASCFYRYSSMLVSKAARVLGYAQDADFYHQLSEAVRSAIIKEYVTPNGRLAVTTQTAYVLALYMDIVPDHQRETTAYALNMKLKETNFHLRTGFIGTPYLSRVLSATGSNNISYRLLLQEDFPSWLYPINMGATTIWERWNTVLPNGELFDKTVASLNHYAYGSIAEWMYRNMCGINPVESAPGFKEIVFRPEPNPRLGFAKAEVNTAMGLVSCGWRYNEDGSVTIEAEVPFNAKATLFIPNTNMKHELLSGLHNLTFKV